MLNPIFFQLFLIFHYAAAMLYLNQILHCILHDDHFQELCLQCEKNYILNQTATSCDLRNDLRISMNCMQISDFGECMRCHCGYVLSEILEDCVIASSSLIGCEITTRENACSRPKTDYLLLKLTNGSISLEFARGSHCEIFDQASNICIQCHSGYKYQQKINQCLQSAQRIFNEYFSFFSQDGELSSRSLQFTARFDGVYPKIHDCLVYARKGDNSILQCEECDAGRTLNERKTKCLKSKVEFCKISKSHSGSEGQITCVECIDNENFFLSSNEFNQQFCLPRQQRDPTTNCLEYFINIPNCQQCPKGLFLTETGCSLEPLESKEQEYYSYDPYAQQSQDSLENCEYWLEENICGSCKKGMIPNNKGTCQHVSDLNCLIAKENSSFCIKCISLMYPSETDNKCISIDDSYRCVQSLGESNACKICISLYYIHSGKQCVLITIKQCAFSDGKENKCAICDNKYFLNEQFSCEKITEFKACILSDGVSNRCTKCSRYCIQDEQGKCISYYTAVNHQCVHPFFYLEESQEEQDFSDESRVLCVEYTFANREHCFRFHPHKNECLECYSGYYISSGECEQIMDCHSSDGINNHCKYFKIDIFFFDDTWKSYSLEKTCLDYVGSHCLFCHHDDLTYGIPVTEIITLSSSQQIAQTYERCARFVDVYTLDVFPQCIHLILTDNNFQCALCINLWYLNENNRCVSFKNNSGCEISDGRTQKCLICSKQYMLNTLTNFCEIDQIQLLPIPFCIKQSGIQCIQCENLYYIELNYCMPLMDPDCESSDGINAICERCKNGQLLSQQNNQIYQPFQTICDSIQCKFTDPQTGNCLECHTGYVRMQSDETSPTMAQFSCAQKRQECVVLNYLQQCLQCKEGYYLDINKTNPKICLLYFINNCIAMDSDGQRCSQCKAGYDLLQSGLCFKQTRCLRFEKAVCLECATEFYLKDGICVSIKNCQVQKGRSCILCSSRYWLSPRQKGQQNLFQVENTVKANINHATVGDHSSTHDSCFLIPHCVESDGLTMSCSQCARGFVLRNTVCIIDHLENGTTTITTSNYCVAYNEDIQCVQCQNLFFLADRKCVPISSSSNCQRNDGINENCEVCSQHGFQLIIHNKDTDKGQEDYSLCLGIQNCVISNGIDRCFACEDNHIVTTSGECYELAASSKILNCYEMSYERTPNLQSQINIEPNLTRNLITSNTPNNIPLGLYCLQCNNLFYLSPDQQECLPLSPERLRNCSFSNGKHDQCSICQQGFILQVDHILSFWITFCVRKPSKINKRLLNQGCQRFNIQTMEFCLKCFEAFFLNSKNGSCEPRNQDFLRKCLRFNKTKDECEICASGFKMKEFQSMNRAMHICMKLDQHEQVENCAEYSPGTNKCIKCEKRLQFDVIEYILDQDGNGCIDVLHLMCRTIDEAQLTCIEVFIPDCEKTVEAQCVECSNGFYLVKENNPQEISSQSISQVACRKHEIIKNCLIYSQDHQDACDACEPYFRVVAGKKNQNECVAITSSNCKHASSSTCIQCEDSRFGIDMNTGNCVENQITKCRELTIEEGISGRQYCHKCQQGYVLSEDKATCKWMQPEMNCKNINNQSEDNHVCQDCKEGYFLNIKGDCLRVNSPCRIANCLEYSQQSVGDSMICKGCANNYVLDGQNQSCLPLDPYSNISEVKSVTEHDNEASNNSIESTYKQKQHPFSWVQLLVCLAIVVVLAFLIHQIIKIWKAQKANQEVSQAMKTIIKNKSKESSLDINIEIPSSDGTTTEMKILQGKDFDGKDNYQDDTSMSFDNSKEQIS